MNLETLWRCLMALPSLLMPALGHHGTTANITPDRERPAAVASPTPTPKPAAAGRVRGTVAPTPAATPKPAAAAAPVPAGKSEYASEQTCPGQQDVGKTAAALTCLTANARVFHGLRPVTANPALMASAAAKDQDMASCGYGHTACGRPFDYWMGAKGYTGRCTAENIAMGQRTPREVFVAWMNSPGHRANILRADYRDIGVAYLAGPQGPLWTMQLGGC